MPSVPEVPLCPFTKSDKNGDVIGSQIIRRQDLVDLGDSFKSSLAPLSDLVDFMKRQVSLVARLQKWLFVLVALVVVNIIVLFVALLVLDSTASSLASAVDKMNDLELRIRTVGNTATRAASAAEAAQRDTQAVASAQATTPRVELIPEPDPVKRRSRPIVLRVIAPPSSASAASPPASVTIPLTP